MDMFNSDRILLSRRGADEVEELVVPERLWGDVDRNAGKFDQTLEFYKKMSVGPRLFVDTVQQNGQSEPSFQDGLHVQKVIAAALESHASGSKVDVG